jgi:ABC-type multidrug transport system fused ATPase/permease subunit
VENHRDGVETWTARHADRIVVLEDGRIAEIGSHES